MLDHCALAQWLIAFEKDLLWSISYTTVWERIKPTPFLSYKKILLSKYGWIQLKIPSHFVRGCCGIYPDCILLPGIQVAAGLGLFCTKLVHVIMKIMAPYYNKPSLLCRSLVEIVWKEKNIVAIETIFISYTFTEVVYFCYAFMHPQFFIICYIANLLCPTVKCYKLFIMWRLMNMFAQYTYT